MIECTRVLELLPWYATGKLKPEDAAEVSAHVHTCETCRSELAEVVWLRHGMLADADKPLPAKQRVWRRVATEAGIYDTARIDVGSLMLGFQLGLNAGRRGSPVRASLRIMGQNVRIVGKKRRTGPTTGEVEE
jgi:hypothetical protein